MASAAIQLDLFGEAEAKLDARAAWLARFERADWIAPWDCADGTRKGESKPGWRCPDPECGEIEPGPSGYLLSINHGWDPDVPGREPFDGRCHKLRLKRSHAEHDAEGRCG